MPFSSQCWSLAPQCQQHRLKRPMTLPFTKHSQSMISTATNSFRWGTKCNKQPAFDSYCFNQSGMSSILKQADANPETREQTLERAKWFYYNKYVMGYLYGIISTEIQPRMIGHICSTTLLDSFKLSTMKNIKSGSLKTTTHQQRNKCNNKNQKITKRRIPRRMMMMINHPNSPFRNWLKWSSLAKRYQVR